MKKIFYTLLFAGLSLGAFSSCDEDRDSNPIMNTNVSSFVLNTPANAVNVYDLENSQNIILTTSQPDYGFTAAVTYTVYMSIDGENFVPTGVTSSSTTIVIPAKTINGIILDNIGDGDLSAPIAVQMYLTANITGQEDLGVIKSNVITLPSVLAYVPVVELTLPEKFFIVGSYKASGWSTFNPLSTGYSWGDGRFYGIVALESGSNFKLSPKDGWGEDMGFGHSSVILDGDLAAGCTSSDDGNFVFNGSTGVYLVTVIAKIANGSLLYTLSFSPANVYVISPTAEAGWAFDSAYQFADNGDGTMTSPALTASGELRLAVDCGTDWWKTEFTIKSDGSLFYRVTDIPNNWAADLGDDYSFQATSGQQIVLDFNTMTGSAK